MYVGTMKHNCSACSNRRKEENWLGPPASEAIRNVAHQDGPRGEGNREWCKWVGVTGKAEGHEFGRGRDHREALAEASCTRSIGIIEEGETQGGRRHTDETEGGAKHADEKQGGGKDPDETQGGGRPADEKPGGARHADETHGGRRHADERGRGGG